MLLIIFRALILDSSRVKQRFHCRSIAVYKNSRGVFHRALRVSYTPTFESGSAVIFMENKISAALTRKALAGEKG